MDNTLPHIVEHLSLLHLQGGENPVVRRSSKRAHIPLQRRFQVVQFGEDSVWYDKGNWAGGKSRVGECKYVATQALRKERHEEGEGGQEGVSTKQAGVGKCCMRQGALENGLTYPRLARSSSGIALPSAVLLSDALEPCRLNGPRGPAP